MSCRQMGSRPCHTKVTAPASSLLQIGRDLSRWKADVSIFLLTKIHDNPPCRTPTVARQSRQSSVAEAAWPRRTKTVAPSSSLLGIRRDLSCWKADFPLSILSKIQPIPIFQYSAISR
jgi:hypothetical protein